MAGPIRTRQACDRCHTQKLRCPKVAGCTSCTRCARMRTPCVFSPLGGSSTTAGSDGSRAGSTPSSTATSGPRDGAGIWGVSGVDPDTSVPALSLPGFDWGAIENMIEAELPPMDFPPVDTSQAAAPDPPVPKASPQQPFSPPVGISCSRKLLDLQIDIDAIHVRLPLLSVTHTSMDESISEKIAAFASQYTDQDFIESIFTVVQRLVDLYPDASATAMASQQAPPCEITNCLHTIELPASLSALEESIEPRTVDAALANNLIACHLRLLEVLDRLAGCSSLCFRLTTASPATPEPEIILPHLKVGSFTPSRQSAMLMQAVLLKNLMDKLQICCKGFLAAVEAKAAKDPSASLRALLLQTEVLSQRHDRNLGYFELMGSYLLSAGLMG